MKPRVGDKVKLKTTKFGISKSAEQTIIGIHEITPEEKEQGADVDGGYWIQTNKLDDDWYAINHFRRL